MWKAKDGLGIAKLRNVRMHVYVCTSQHVAPLARCAVSMHQCNLIYATSMRRLPTVFNFFSLQRRRTQLARRPAYIVRPYRSTDVHVTSGHIRMHGYGYHNPSDPISNRDGANI